LKEFTDRGKVLDNLRSKAEKELKEKLQEKTKQLKKSCIFW
jgi:hypothetical protein